MPRIDHRIWPIVTLIMFCQGCAHGLVSRRCSDPIPARRLPACLAAFPREALVPTDLGLLRVPPPEEHLVDSGDVLGIYIQDVLEESGRLPLVDYRVDGQRTNVESPAVGHPVCVQPDGTISLPQTAPIRVSGLKLGQVVEAIRRSYVERAILKPGHEHISVSLIKPRTYRVIVIREDLSAPVTLKASSSQVLTRHGQGHVLELPAYENDLLRAITLTGGLPGTDAENEIVILRSDGSPPLERLDRTETMEQLLQTQAGSRITRVPLRVVPGAPLPFTPGDMILGDGDIVLIASRKNDYFLAGGLMEGGKFPLPRDEDVDVLEAIAIANGSINGPLAASNVTISTRGPGNVVPPTRVIIVRTLDDGSQINIEVDLKIAMQDARERILIQPGDLVVLKYKTHEILANVALNFVNISYLIPN